MDKLKHRNSWVEAGAVVVAIWIAAVIGLVADRTSRGEEKSTTGAVGGDAKEALKTVELTVSPAGEPYAAFKYRLLPHGIEKTPGNAAPHYFRAALVWGSSPQFQEAIATPDANKNSNLEDWLEMPLNELSKNQDAQSFFNSCPTGNWDLINLAARREQCEWDLPIREMNISTLIPELQKMRDLGRLLAFKARIEISRGEISSAIETLKTGMALGRHATQAPTLVNALVGAAITRMMLDEVRELIQQPNCPNLYWSLTALPDRLLDLSPGLEFESDFVYLFLPELRDVRNAVHTEAEWDKILLTVSEKLVKVLPGVGDHPKDLSWYGMGAVFAVTAYPKAKAQLQEAGYTPAQIKAMPASQAILTAEMETYEHLSNDYHKWFYADSAAALKGLADEQKKMEEFNQSHREIIPIASLLLPALGKAKSTQVETDRYLAALRMVEALRLYAAEHDDHLPAALDEIKMVPLPIDPVTGKTFEYALHDGAAVITSPAPPERTAAEGLRWEIELAAAKK